MENENLITTQKETAIDKAIFRAVAKVNGGSDTHKNILSLLEVEFSSHRVTKMINGNTDLSIDELKVINKVLNQFDKTISIEDLIHN